MIKERLIHPSGTISSDSVGSPLYPSSDRAAAPKASVSMELEGAEGPGLGLELELRLMRLNRVNEMRAPRGISLMSKEGNEIHWFQHGLAQAGTSKVEARGVMSRPPWYSAMTIKKLPALAPS